LHHGTFPNTKIPHRVRTLSLGKADLIILKFSHIPFGIEGARLPFQVISKSYETRSIVFTTNIEFSHWKTILADDKLATASMAAWLRLRGKTAGWKAL
jgi:DNA replication protein DnaC